MEGKKRISGVKLALKTSIVSGMTLLSRILGLVRDIVFARFFGAGLLMDAFLVAQRIPNMLRRFFAEGAFSAGFVPVMARYKERHGHDEAREYVDAMAGTFGVVLFVVLREGLELDDALAELQLALEEIAAHDDRIAEAEALNRPPRVRCHRSLKEYVPWANAAYAVVERSG